MISPLAQVSPNAKLGEGVIIDAFSTIHDDVVIGAGTRIHSNVNIYPGARIGENCEIYPGAVISVVPQDLKFDGEYTTVEIGDRTVIRECVTIHRGTKDRWKTTVGNDCLLMTYVHIAHDCQIGNNVIMASYSGLSGHCVVGDYAILEGRCGSQQFVHVGAHSFVAGGSLIRKNVPPYVKCAREPLTYAGINSVGLRRRGYTDEQVREIEDIYRIIFVQNNHVTKSLDIVKETIADSPIRREILSFIEASDKGVIKGLI